MLRIVQASTPLKAIVLGYSALLFAGIVCRACFLPITIDEALAVGFAAELTLSDIYADANFHPLNSIWINLSLSLFGYNELALRIPNVLAALVYFRAAQRLAGTHAQAGVFVSIWVLLISNPFILDFFTVARGYGMGIAATAMCLACLYEAFSCDRVSGCLVWGVVAVLANYSFAPFVLPAFCLLIFHLAGKRDWSRFASVLFILCILVTGLSWISFELDKQGLLYFGGRSAFLFSTVKSLILSFGYEMSYAGFIRVLGWSVFWFGCSAIALWWGVFLVAKEKNINDGLSVFVLAGGFIIVVLAAFRGTYFVVERTAIGFYVVFVCALGDLVRSKLADCVGRLGVRFLYIVIVTGLMSHGILSSIKFSTYNWFTDLSVRDVARFVDESDDGNRKVIGACGILVPALDFYKKKYNYHFEIEAIDELWMMSEPGREALRGVYYGSTPSPRTGRPNERQVSKLCEVLGYRYLYILERPVRGLESSVGRYKLLRFPKSSTALLILKI